MELTFETDWKIGRKFNEETSEVTLYFSNKPYGPIVTGENEAQAWIKFEEAFWVFVVATSCLYLEKKKQDAATDFVKNAKKTGEEIDERAKEALKSLAAC